MTMLFITGRFGLTKLKRAKIERGAGAKPVRCGHHRSALAPRTSKTRTARSLNENEAERGIGLQSWGIPGHPGGGGTQRKLSDRLGHRRGLQES